MKKILFISITCLLLLCGCANKMDEKEGNESKIGQIQNLKESSNEIPDFMIFIRGLVDTTVMKTEMEYLKAYDFVVETKDESSKIVSNSWTGIRLTDILELKKIDTFDSIYFRSGDKEVSFLKEEITDDIYLVLYKNDKLITDISSTGVMLYAPTFGEDYAVTSLFKIEII